MSIKSVALRAGVSTATVSRFINQTVTVAPETADRIRESIKALNFYPDVNARTLGSGRSGMFGLIISDITNPYFPELVKGFEDIAVDHGLEVLVANTDYDPHRMKTCVTRMLQRKVDGVAIMTSEMDDELICYFTTRKIPIILTDAQTEVPEVHAIRVDYEAGVIAAIEHLYELNHERIAFISGPLGLNSARIRAEAFRQVLQSHGSSSGAWFEEGDHRVLGGHRAMQSLLKAGADRPTAVMASNDLTAIGAMGAIHEAGLRIPEDISIVGFDGIELSRYTQPALTTVLVPRRQMAMLAFQSLLNQRQEEFRVKGVESVVTPTLLVRASTAAVTPTFHKTKQQPLSRTKPKTNLPQE
jgi:DNA-binding LacI/PurR family transcriptional regulator